MAAGSILEMSGGPDAAFEAPSDETASFHAMASAFHDLLVARTGHTDRAGGLQALNADFLAWIATDPRYGGGSGR